MSGILHLCYGRSNGSTTAAGGAGRDELSGASGGVAMAFDQSNRIHRSIWDRHVPQ